MVAIGFSEGFGGYIIGVFFNSFIAPVPLTTYFHLVIDNKSLDLLSLR